MIVVWCADGDHGVELNEAAAMFDRMLATLGAADAVTMLTQSVCSTTNVPQPAAD